MANPGYWLNEQSRKFLGTDYLPEGQSPEDRIVDVAEAVAAELNMPELRERVIEVLMNGWSSLSTPFWTNLGNERGLPISCNNSHVDDRISSILHKLNEIGQMTKFGAGTSVYLGAIRHQYAPIRGGEGGVADGPMTFARMFDLNANTISQDKIRRGFTAAYLDAEHKDIMPFLDIRDEEHEIQGLGIGVCIGDAWMWDMLNGDEEKGKIWARIIQKRFETGFPYLFFRDNVNKVAPQVYRDNGIVILSSNMCTEVLLASTAEESFVCDLLSMNVIHYEEWKDTHAVETCMYILEAAMSEYIRKLEALEFIDYDAFIAMRAPLKFAKKWRAVGLGVLGWHSFLQSKMLAVETPEARAWNVTIFSDIQRQADAASAKMAVQFGEPEGMKGYGYRHVTRMAIAPTTSSAFILGQASNGIEPYDSNYFTSDLQKGVFGFKNPYLLELLQKLGKDTREVWEKILIAGGSVQGLSFLSRKQKDVFKTWGEINQGELIAQAAERGRYIDQGQSLNIKIHPDTDPADVSDLYITGWELGIKTFYYQRSTNKAQEYARGLVSCRACEA